MIDYAAKLAIFLTNKVSTPLGQYRARMTAAQQRELFGRVIGRGTIVIDGENETVRNRVKVCFGADYDDRNITAWRALA